MNDRSDIGAADKVMEEETLDYPIISADSHVLEPPDCYSKYIDAKWKDQAPTLISDNGVYAIVEGFPRLKISNHFGPGMDPLEREALASFEELTVSGWDPRARRADQLIDGIAAEVLYPSLGLILCNVPDYDYQAACFAAYNRWLSEYCSADPLRLIGCGQTAMRSPGETVADLREIKALGLRGVALPGLPAVDDFDSPVYDEFWATAIELDLPLVFHVVAVGGGKQGFTDPGRGPKINAFMKTMRGLQDLMGVLVFGGVFDRHPNLKIVFAEGDAGWVPHYMHRMDRAYLEHQHKFVQGRLEKMPSDYVREHFYFTFQDDPTAWQFADWLNWRRLMWANDFPHADATWPRSQELLGRQTPAVNPEQKKAILCDNAAAIFKIDIDRLATSAAA